MVEGLSECVSLGLRFFRYLKRYGLKASLEKALFWWRLRVKAGYKYQPPDISQCKQILAHLKHKPLISVLIPVYNPFAQHLKACLDSVLNQLYPYWEACVVDDGSRDKRIKEILETYKRRDARIKVVYHGCNRHISSALNTALMMAKGEFVALLDHDDELTPDALLEVARLLNAYPQADMIYSDEDKISPSGKYILPHFKPDWSPELFLGQMYTSHLGVYRKKLLEEIGGFREGFEGSQDYDLVLRLSEKTDNIFHIPKVLYHWRIHQGSVACGNPHIKHYAYQNALKAIKEALKRRGEGGWVEEVEGFVGRYLVHYPLKGEPLISIVIPTRDKADLLEKCLRSVVEKTSYKRVEFVIVDNGSKEADTFRLFKRWQERLKGQFKVVRYDIPFNFSLLVNQGVKAAAGELILLLNNDVELIGPASWLEEMGGYALREEIGCVGAVLLYPDNTIQHGGIFLGVSGDPSLPPVARHAFKGQPASYPGYFDHLKVVTNYAAVTAACMMVRRELWEKVGGFDETLAVSFNDVDFCLRLLKNGYRHVVLPHVRLYHYESKSRGYEQTKRDRLRFLKEVYIMRKRWQAYLDHDPYLNPNLKTLALLM